MTKSELEELVRAHQTELYRYLRFLGASAAEAEDLVQETFLTTYKSTNPPDLSAVARRASWLRGVSRNLFLAYCRKETKRRAAITELTLEHDEQFWVSRFLGDDNGFVVHEALRFCLKTVPEKSRQILKWFYADRLSRKETAEAAGMTDDGIKSFLRRIRSKLASCIRTRLDCEDAL